MIASFFHHADRPILTLLILTLTTGAALAQTPWDVANQQRWQFPGSMKVKNVREHFGAKGDGLHDDTQALRRAFDRRGGFVYIPDGTYRITEQLQYTQGPSIGPTIQGESRDGVILRLDDGSPGFNDPANPRAVVRLIRDGKVSADYFKTKIRNLTIDVGDNRGAVGLNFYANNNGQCRNVRITGAGAIGVDLSYMLNGPLLISNLEVDGFDIGIHAGSGPFNSQTLEHIVLKGQRSIGIRNEGEALFIRDLLIDGPPAPIINGGNTVLVDADLRSAQGPAIRNSDRLFLRNVKTSPAHVAVQGHQTEGRGKLGPQTNQTVPGGIIDEWVHDRPLGQAAAKSIRSVNLAIETAPCTPLPPLDDWICVDDFGADGTDEQDDTPAFRRAFAAAKQGQKKVVAFAAESQYIVGGELEISGSIERLQGAASLIRPPMGEELRIIVRDGSADIVTFDQVDRPLGRHRVVVTNASSRTLVVHHLRGELLATGPGKTFLEDACSNVRITHPLHRVWSRQLNSESSEATNNTNDGGTLWVLGLKTERSQTLVETLNGGRTEVLGAWVYVTSREAPTRPMFVVEEGVGSFAGVLQFHSRGAVYDTLVQFTKSGERATVTRADNDGRASFGLLRVGGQ